MSCILPCYIAVLCCVFFAVFTVALPCVYCSVAATQHCTQHNTKVYTALVFCGHNTTEHSSIHSTQRNNVHTTQTQHNTPLNTAQHSTAAYTTQNGSVHTTQHTTAQHHTMQHGTKHNAKTAAYKIKRNATQQYTQHNVLPTIYLQYLLPTDYYYYLLTTTYLLLLTTTY